MKITQEQLDALNSPLRKKRIKLELLDRDLKVLDTLEGYATDGSINVDANSTIRRSGSITMAIPDNKSSNDFLESIDGLEISVEGKLWIDKYIKIYVGLDKTTNKTTNTVWYKLGVFLIDRPVKDFSATSHQISFNCIDRMAELTGDRQGQLTGIGTNILKGEYIEGDSYSFSGYWGHPRIIQKSSVSNIDNIDWVALATDYSPYLQVGQITKYGLQSLRDVAGLSSAVSDIKWSNNFHSGYGNFLALSNSSGTFIYSFQNDFSIYKTISTSITRATGFYFNNDDSKLYFSAFNDTTLYEYTLSTNSLRQIGDGKMPKLTPNEDYLIALDNNKLVAYDTTNFNTANIFPSEISQINVDTFTIDKTIKHLFAATKTRPYNFYLDLSTAPYSLLGSIPNLNLDDSLYCYSGTYNRNGSRLLIRKALKVTDIPFEIQTELTNEDGFLLYDTSAIPYRQIPNSIDILSTSNRGSDDNSPRFYLSDLFFFKDCLMISGEGGNVYNSNPTSCRVIVYSIQNGINIYKGTKTVDALTAVIEDFTNIKKYTIHDIPADYEYLPFDITVGTSATVWDILQKFKEILNDWEFYFDNDGVFRIEPLISGEKAPVYPISFNTYISDELSYDFGNVKNQVVVYGKLNNSDYYTENVSYSGDTLILKYESLIQKDGLSIKGTKFGFLTPQVLNSNNISKISIQSGQSWTEVSNSNINSFTKSYYIEGKWYYSVAQSASIGGVYRSNNGTDWEKISTMSTLDLTFGAGILVAATQNGIYWKDESDNWTLANGSGTSYFNCIMYSNDLFVAGSNTTGLYYSSDGKNWTQSNITNIKINAINYTAYSYNYELYYKWEASTASGIYYSDNGNTWTQSNITTSITSQVKSKVEYDSLYSAYFASMLVGNYYSSNGTTWAQIEPNNFSVESFEYVSNKVIAYGALSGIPYLYIGHNTVSTFSPGLCPVFLYDLVKKDNNTALGLAADGLYETKDGISWKKILSTSSSVQSVCVHDSSICVFTIGKIYFLKDFKEEFSLNGSLVSFEKSIEYVPSETLQPNEIYTVRIIEAFALAQEDYDTTSLLTFELYSKQQPSACLVDDNFESPFYINNGLKGTNFYAGTAETSSGYNFGEEYKLTLNNTSPLSSLADGTQITFMANYLNSYASGETSTKITVVTSDGATLKTALPLVADNNLYNTPVGEGKLSRDYTIHLIQYNATNNVFIYKGITPTAYTLVLSGGEYDNIHADQLAYERCLWELYTHSNMQDSISLGIVPNYGLDVNYKISYQDEDYQPFYVKEGPVHQPFATVDDKDFYVKMDAQSQFFLVKKISFSLGLETTSQVVSAIRIYDSGNLLGD